MVNELYDRPFILTPLIIKIEPEIEVENIWSVPMGEGKKIKIQSDKKQNLKKAKKNRIHNEKDRWVRVQEIQVGAIALNWKVIILRGVVL